MGTIQKQGLINTVIIYAGVAFGFLNQVIVQPHYLTTDEIGLTRVIINFGGFLTTFLLLGASSTCVKFFPAFKDPKTGHHGFLGIVLLIALSGIIISACIFYPLQDWIAGKYKAESDLFVRYFYWEFPLAVVMTLSIAINSYSNSHLKTVIPSFLNDVWVRILLITFTILYSFKIVSLDFFVTSIFITYLTQLFFISIYVFRIDKPSLKIDWPYFRSVGGNKLVRFTLFMSLTALSSISLKFLDTIMIGAYKPLKFAGIYALGAFIAQFIETPLYSVERIAAVKIAHGFESNNLNEIKEIYYRSVRLLFLAGGFLVICIITNIYDFLTLLPPDFKDAAGVTIIISIGSIINMATGVNSPIINNSSKYTWSLVFLFILLFTTIGLNMWLIPLYGMEGCAIATGLASVLYNLLKFFFIWKNFGMQPYDLNTLKTVFIIAITFSVIWFLPVPSNAYLAIFERGSLTVIIYGTLAWFLRISPEMKQMLGSLFRRKKA